MKVQRPSKTQTQLHQEKPIIEEWVLSGWDLKVSRVAPEANAGSV